MPSYMITDNQTGKKFKVTGDSPPSESEAAMIFQRMGGDKPNNSRVIRQDANYTEDPAKIERARREFVRTEKANLGTGEKLKMAAADIADKLPTRRSLANLVRPTLEGGGATLGGIIGGGGALVAGNAGPQAFVPEEIVTVPAATIAGSSLGFGIGKNIADTIEGNYAKTPAEAATRTLKDLGTGATYEMGGQVAGKMISAGVEKLPQVTSRTPLKDLASTRAKQVLDATSQLTEQEAANLAKGQELTNRLGIKLTPAQMTGKPSLAALEQGLASTDPAFSATLNAQDAAAKAKAISNMRAKVGPLRPLPNTQDVQTTGQNIADQLSANLKSVKAAERDIWSKVPDYPMPSENTAAVIQSITSTPLDEETTAAVTSAVNFIKTTPKTTKGLQAIDQTLGSDIDRARRAGNNKVARALGEIREGIKADFEAMGTAAATGDVALHNGNIVYPSKLEAEYAKNAERIAAETSVSTATPDIKAITELLRTTGYPVMRQVAEPEATHAQRLVKAYEQKFIGQSIPTMSGQTNKTINDLSIRQKQIEQMFAELEPVENVASAYKAAKDFSRTQKFDRFGKGQVKNVLRAGDQTSGLIMPYENIPRQFITPSGADGLIRAVGKKAATEQMRPFVLADMTKDGERFTVESGLRYIQKNRVALEKFGLVSDARQVLKDRFPAEIEKMIAKRAPDPTTGQQFLTSQDMRGILQKYGNTIKQLYGTETLGAFRDYNQLLGMIERKNIIPRGAGSNTAEKAMNVANLMIKESVGPAKKLTDGLLLAIAKGATLGGGATMAAGNISPKVAAIGGTLMAARQMVANGQGIVAQAFTKILKDATLNPQVAKDLMSLQRTGKVPATLQSIIDNHLIGGSAIGVASPD